MDAQAEAIENLLAESRARRLVHGHTHRPGWHRLRIGDDEAERIVLGPWDGEARVLVLGEKDARLVPPPL
jgi:UDP-2,3-diacylglucosamine hydrolase